MEGNVSVGSTINKNTLLYGNCGKDGAYKNMGPSCVDMQGEKGAELNGPIDIAENNKKPARP